MFSMEVSYVLIENSAYAVPLVAEGGTKTLLFSSHRKAKVSKTMEYSLVNETFYLNAQLVLFYT